MEIRVIIQRPTIPVLTGLAAFIVRNLPFVAQVALMGLEMIENGQAKERWGGLNMYSLPTQLGVIPAPQPS